MSLEYQGVLAMKAVRPDWPVGLLSSVAVGYVFDLEIDFIAVNSLLIDREFMVSAKLENMPVWVWTLNDQDTIDAYISLGVSGIITDYPPVVHRVLKHRQNYTVVERVLLYLSDWLDGKERP